MWLRSGGASVRRLFPVGFQKIALNVEVDPRRETARLLHHFLPHNPIGGQLVPVQD
jgi:cytochrome oxidase Cu insertion factor (SCO1/SenC/PrrC family)